MVSTRVTPVTVVMMVPCSVTVRTPVVVIVTGSVTVRVTTRPERSVEVTVLATSSVEVDRVDLVLEDLVLEDLTLVGYCLGGC